MKTQNGFNSLLSLSKYSMVASTVLFSMALTSAGFADTPSAADEYAGANPGAETPAEVVKEVEGSLECTDAMCTLFTMTVNKKTFTISSYAGVGSSQQNAGSNNNYYGYTAGQSSGGTGTPSYGVQVSWDNTNCTKSVVVPNTVQDAVMTYWHELKNRTPGEDPTYPQFTPAEETMILFYTTVMELTKGTTCN